MGTVTLWLRQLRVHQYVKNTLVLIPVVAAHQFSPTAIVHAFMAFVAFSLWASAVYIFNDLADLDEDRRHPTKKLRPLASGAIDPRRAKAAIPLLLALGLACAAAVSLKFLLVLLVYLGLTTAYSISLKRKMLVDVVVLAMLYTLRVIAGAVAISVEVSAWLLAFSMFMFFSLALMKRYSELVLRIDNSLPDPSNRNYKLNDLTIVACLAVASGFNAVTVLALYISSPAVQQIYSHPEVLWAACPVLMYWIGRAMIMAHRRMMHDDPIVFAVKDRVSHVAGVVVVALVVLAMWK